MPNDKKPANQPKSNNSHKDEIVKTHYNDDSNNQYEKTADGEIIYLNDDILDLQRSDDDNIKGSNDDDENPHLTKQDRII